MKEMYIFLKGISFKEREKICLWNLKACPAKIKIRNTHLITHTT